MWPPLTRPVRDATTPSTTPRPPRPHRRTRQTISGDAMSPRHSLETLEHRIQFAVTAAFLPTAGILTVFGDSLDNNITVSRNAAGQILVNGGAVAVQGGTTT